AAARSAESHEGDTMSTEKLNKEQIHARVTAAYGAAARAREEGTQAAACCAPEQRTASDYTAEELASVPRGAYLGEGSGAPVRYANLEPGEAVVEPAPRARTVRVFAA